MTARAQNSATPQTVGELLQAGTSWLERRNVEFPRVVCEQLASHLLHCPRLELLLHTREVPPPPVVEAWRNGLKRVAEGAPLQYVLGEWDFRNLTLTVDRRALIPRPETEQLVDLLLAEKSIWDQPHPFIVDVGTGSGCIVLSLATERPQARYVAVDASAEALSLARENAARCGVAKRVDFRQAQGAGEFPAGSVDALVANLPYIPTATVNTLARHVRDHEPRMALDGGADGLDIVRAVMRDAAMVLRPKGWIFLEIGDEQGPAVAEWMDRMGLANIAILSDLSGKTRFARARHGG
jgi:release factor glutamine methyltransferase